MPVFTLKQSDGIKLRCLAFSLFRAVSNSSFAGVLLYSRSSKSESQSAVSSEHISIFNLSLSLKASPAAVEDIIRITAPANFIIDFSCVNNFGLVCVFIKQNNV